MDRTSICLGNDELAPRAARQSALGGANGLSRPQATSQTTVREKAGPHTLLSTGTDKEGPAPNLRRPASILGRLSGCASRIFREAGKQGSREAAFSDPTAIAGRACRLLVPAGGEDCCRPKPFVRLGRRPQGMRITGRLEALLLHRWHPAGTISAELPAPSAAYAASPSCRPRYRLTAPHQPVAYPGLPADDRWFDGRDVPA
jgi:hypothetical protein